MVLLVFFLHHLEFDSLDFRGFNIANFIDAAFKELRSDVELQAVVGIGQYVTTLNYTQLSVPIVTDSSLNYIIPVLAKPIVQKIVDRTIIGLDYYHSVSSTRVLPDNFTALTR